MKHYQWLAIVSMIFAGLTSVLAKAGLKNVGADTALALRTSFVFALVWANIFAFHSTNEFSGLTRKDVVLLAFSALGTTLSWLFYYRAIKTGDLSQVALIDKGSIVVTLLFSVVFLGEVITFRMAVGAGLILAGILVLTLK